MILLVCHYFIRILIIKFKKEIKLLYYCCAEIAGFSFSEVHCEPDTA